MSTDEIRGTACSLSPITRQYHRVVAIPNLFAPYMESVRCKLGHTRWETTCTQEKLIDVQIIVAVQIPR
jgi:hypothetical protein